MWHAIKDFLSAQQADAPEVLAAEPGESPFELSEADVPAEQTPETAPYLRALRDVVDPELGLNIVDLGLVYALEVDDEAGQRTVRVAVTATTPACPMAGVILEDVEGALRAETDGDGQHDVEVYLVWEPPWSPERMSQRAHDQLGGFGR